MKKKLLYTAMLGVFLAIVGILVGADLGEWFIDGNKVYVDDNLVYISAEPHTITGSSYVTFNFTSKVYTGDVDIVLGADTDSFKPKLIEWYNPETLNRSMSYTCESEHFNYTLSPKYAECFYLDNASELRLAFNGSFESGNLSAKTIYWNESYDRDWRDFSTNIQTLNYDYEGMNKWYYKQNIPIVQDTEYIFRIYLKVLDTGNKEHKYWFAIKPSDETIQEAIANGHLYALDPWFVSDYDWNDDFETGVINSSFWTNDTHTTNGGGCTVYAVGDEDGAGAGDGYVRLEGYVHCPTNSGTAQAWMESVVDYNTGEGYKIEFTMEVLSGSVRIDISNDTILDSDMRGDNRDGITVLAEGVTNGIDNYTLYINNNSDGNATLYNSTDFLAMKNLTYDIHHVQFRAESGCGPCTSNNSAFIYNFTSSPLTSVTLNSPLNNTNQSAPITFNCSYVSGTEGNNVSLYGTWAGGFHLNQTNEVFGTANETTFSVTPTPDGTYTWTCLLNQSNDATVWGNNRTFLIDNTYPNLTINEPSGTIGNKTVTINITTADEREADTCWFNISRGASTEVGNTQIENCHNSTATVSSDADYVLWVFVNDTVGNTNVTSSAFTVDTSVPVVTGGGGGGTPITAVPEPTEFVSVCVSFEEIFRDSWENSKLEESIIKKIDLVWNAFWDFMLCKSASSIVPI